jgi:preprotein translocase subunit YajC
MEVDMNWLALNMMLAEQMQQDPRAQFLGPVGMFVIMGFLLYFAILRPQQKKAKQHEALMKAIKPGDKVVTSGGILGVVVTVREKTVSLRSADSKLEVLKSAVAEVVEKSSASSGS